MSRKSYRTIAYTLVDEGYLSEEALIQMCLSYMSEADVEDMLRANDILFDPDRY